MEGDLGFRRSSVSGVSTDSRTINESELFIALKGDRFDGHDFLETAFARGAAAAIISAQEAQKRNLHGPRYIVVADTLRALGDLARAYRERMSAQVIAVTGSNGKTTVKNLVYEVISRDGQALKSQGNLNNLVGLPLSIFQLRDHHKSAVFELGMSARGEIARLGEIAHPDIAVITNVGPVHLEFLGSIEEVANAKREILPQIRHNGTLIINGDDEFLSGKLWKTPNRTIRFGLEPSNEINPQDLRFDGDQLPSFSVGGYPVELKLPGICNVYNALAAIAVAGALGIGESKAADAVSSYLPEGMRSEIVHLHGITLIVDCYNANPVSTRSTLETLSRIECGGRRIAVLGDMLELGEKGKFYHQDTGKHARQLGIDTIFGYGTLTKSTVESFGRGARHFDTKEGLSRELIDFINKGDVILFKGSRGMALEEVVDAVKKNW